MNTTDNLFIRACKSKEPIKRIESVYRRFYCKNDDPNPHITRILARICEDYNLCTILQILDSMDENKRFNVSDEESMLYTFMGFIRFANIDKFEDYRVPAKFRNKIHGEELMSLPKGYQLYEVKEKSIVVMVTDFSLMIEEAPKYIYYGLKVYERGMLECIPYELASSVCSMREYNFIHNFYEEVRL